MANKKRNAAYKNGKDGIAIAIAWPETLCKQPGSWYDSVVPLVGINSNGYYKVGHAAVVLIDKNSGDCLYYDFGRYHAPHGYGRVRSFITDHDLKMSSKAIISENGNDILNIDEILMELHNRPSTHGIGRIVASYTSIKYKRSLKYILHLQKRTFIPYGPFIIGGTNCSRFVNSAVFSGRPTIWERIKLFFPLTISPTPNWNIKAVGKEVFVFGESIKEVDFIPVQPIMEVIYS